MKRGQVTVFVIIALIILASCVLFLKFNSSSKKGILSEQPLFLSDNDEYYIFFSECFKDSVADSMMDFLKSGAYYSSPQLGKKILFFEYPYYFSGMKNYLPTKEKIEYEISLMSLDNAEECYMKLERELRSKGIESNNGASPSAVSKINKDSISIELDYTINIATSSREKFTANLPFSFLNEYDAIAEYVNMQVAEEGLCWSCLYDVSKKYDLNISNEIIDDKTILFTFKNQYISWIFLGEIE